MRYFKLMFPNDDDAQKFYQCEIDDFEEKYGVSPYLVDEGETISNWPKEITFEFSSKKAGVQPDFLNNNLGWLIISPKVQEIFKSFNTANVDFMNVTVVDTFTKEVFTDYKVVVVKDFVDALNEELSDMTKLTLGAKSIISVKKYVLFTEPIGDKDWFKLPESNFATFVSEKVVEAFKKASITGVTFLEVG